MTAQTFGLIAAQSAESRMEALCQFLEFWLGPRRPEFGEPEEELAKIQLPLPLRRLYAFCGRWPSRKFGISEEYLVPFMGQDRLRKPQFAETRTDGRIMFLAESQGVWHCYTLPTGDDPPVWRGEMLISSSLSRFLTTLILREVTFGAHVSLYDKHLGEVFASEKEQKAIPVWLNEIYADGVKCSFYLWDHVLVLEERNEQSGGFSYGANDMTGARFLRKQRIDVNEIVLQDFGLPENENPDNWVLGIRSDGSACLRELGKINGEAEAPAGTFEFRSLRDSLTEMAYLAIYQLGEFNGDPIISFRGVDSYEASHGCYAPSNIAKSLYLRALDSAPNVSDEFRNELVKRWGTVDEEDL